MNSYQEEIMREMSTITKENLPNLIADLHTNDKRCKPLK